jgi:hypothetical protein
MMIMTGGSLILVVPMNEGIVIAADSRQILNSFYVDGVQKINVLESRNDVAFFGTGNLNVVNGRGSIPDRADMMAEWIKNSFLRYDIIQVVGEFLNRKPHRDLSHEYINSISAHCRQDMELELDKDRFIPFQGSEHFCTVTLVQYKAHTKVGMIGGFDLGYDENGKLIKFDHDAVDLTRKTRCNPVALGMTQYLYGEDAKHFAPPRSFELFQRFRKSLVGQLTRPDAVRLAGEMMDTAIRVAASRKVEPNKIGGKVDLCVIDGINPPAGIAPLGRVKHPEEAYHSLTTGLDGNS